MPTILEQGDNWVLTLSKTVFSQNFLNRLLELIELEALAQRNQMTEQEAWEISEDIKTTWWAANGERILGKIHEAAV